MASNAVVLDSGALSALAETKKPARFAVRFALRQALKSGADVLVPTVVIAESTTGDSRLDANVNRTLKALTLVDLDERIARNAAALRFANRTRRSGTVDAIVVATADRVPGSCVLTADPNDLRPLAAVADRTTIVPL